MYCPVGAGRGTDAKGAKAMAKAMPTRLQLCRRHGGQVPIPIPTRLQLCRRHGGQVPIPKGPGIGRLMARLGGESIAEEMFLLC